MTVRRGCDRLLGSLLAVAAGLALLTACGSNDAATGRDPDPSVTASVSQTPTPEKLVPDRPPRKQDGVVSIQGTVAAGVEAGCLVLTNAGGQYTLLGAVTPALVGQEVIVTGTADEDLATTCQQGTPFTVTQVLTR